ncbi:hypothetical protein [Brevibacterium moorei]|uniref:hypothetical protein n=1 Tax=Brevibacterium moorei TaxID=2968457 RepID=UPI00211B9773|nr:hypothetical protein [Brevibacterium sp. 68QC2CO]MCQ9385202.1 hypothetical protein [Brevibacterium sp. 68QC2CO]
MSLWPVWLIIAVLAVIGMIIASLAVVAGAGRTDRGPVIVRLTLWCATIVTVFTLLGAITNTAVALLNDQTAITLTVEPFWPTLPAGAHIEGPTAHLEDGGLTSGEVLLSGLSASTKICWAIGQGLAWLLPATLAFLVSVMCRKLLAGQAFSPVVSRLTLIAAFVIAIGGIAMAILADTASSLAAQQLLEYTGAEVPETGGKIDWLGDMWPQAGGGIGIPLWPIGAGLGLAALSVAFRYGTRLEHETEGLI